MGGWIDFYCLKRETGLCGSYGTDEQIFGEDAILAGSQNFFADGDLLFATYIIHA